MSKKSSLIGVSGKFTHCNTPPMKTSLLFSITLFLLFTLHSQGQTTEQHIQAVADNYLSDHSPGIAIIASKGGKTIYKQAFGMSDVANSKALKTDQVFRIGSITKQFTAVAILKLAHERKLSLNDPIQPYLSTEKGGKDITILQLLNHTSGMGNQSDIPSFDPQRKDTDNYPADMMEAILETPLKFPAGTQFAYSNLGYIVLGRIIEKVSGKPYETYLKETFFGPLAMKNTGFEYLKDFSASMSKGHTFRDGQYMDASAINMKMPFSAGALVSTLDDLATWNRAVMQGEVLPSSYIQKISSHSTLQDGTKIPYSMGWYIGNIQGSKTIKHDGIVNGYTAMGIYLPKEDIYLAVLSNCEAYRDIEIPASKIAALLIQNPFPTGNMKLDQDFLESYQGTYQSANKRMNIVLQEKTLVYYSKGGNKIVLEPVGKHKFLISGSLDQIQFKPASEQTGYMLHDLQSITEWKKIAPLKAYQNLTLQPDEQQEYVGRYQVPNTFIFEVLQVDGKMYGQIGNDRKEILCVGEDLFCARDIDALLNFSRNKNGQITTLNLEMGMKMVAQRMD